MSKPVDMERVSTHARWSASVALMTMMIFFINAKAADGWLAFILAMSGGACALWCIFSIQRMVRAEFALMWVAIMEEAQKR